MNPNVIYRAVGLTIAAIGLVTALAASAEGRRYALLVGVGTYADSQHLRKLQGPSNDVPAMKQALAPWGFDRITTLQDAEATRAAILKALDALTHDAEPGSHVLFYYSSHGTSPVDPKFGAGLALPHTTGALLTYDTRRSGDAQTIRDSLIIGRSDLRPRFEALDRKGVHLTAWIDACFSENSTHSLAGFTPRAESITIPGFNPGGFGSAITIPGFNPGGFGSGSGGYQPYPYQNVVTFAASAANQTAVDIDEKTLQQNPTLDGRAHGAFSDALLRALNDRNLPGYGVLDKNGDGVVSVEEFATGVTSFMASRAYGHQPKLQPLPLSEEDPNGTRNQPLFLADQRPQPTAPAPALATPAPAAPAPAASARLRVAFTGPDEPRRALAALPMLELVASGAEVRVAPDGAGFTLADGAGAQIGRVDSAAALQEALRRRALLNRIASAAQQSGRATVGLELTNPYASSRLPIGDATHCVKVDLAYKADQPGYPLVIDLFSDGGVQWLYPLAGADDRKQQQQWQQPSPAGQGQRLWSAQTTPPPGVDTAYTFLLNQPLPPDVITGTYTIAPTDGARFDLLLDALGPPGRVRGAHRLSLELYQPQPGELQGWKEEKCR